MQETVILARRKQRDEQSKESTYIGSSLQNVLNNMTFKSTEKDDVVMRRSGLFAWIIL